MIQSAPSIDALVTPVSVWDRCQSLTIKWSVYSSVTYHIRKIWESSYFKHIIILYADLNTSARVWKRSYVDTYQLLDLSRVRALEVNDPHDWFRISSYRGYFTWKITFNDILTDYSDRWFSDPKWNLITRCCHLFQSCVAWNQSLNSRFSKSASTTSH